MAEQWRLTIASPKAEKREHWLRAVARRRRPDGRIEERACSTDTLDRAQAEAFGAAWLKTLDAIESGAAPVAVAGWTVLRLVDARLASIVRDPEASPNTARLYKALRRAVASTCLADLTEVRVAQLIQAQDEIAAGAGGDAARKSSTVRAMLAQLAAVWRWGVDGELVRGEWPKIPRRRAAKAVATKKRGYLDHEVCQVLAWVDVHAPQWSAVFHLLADTGQRVGAVLGLRGKAIARGPEPVVTFSEQWVRSAGGKRGGWRPLKTREVVAVPVPDETAAILPDVGPDELLFPNQRDPARPASDESVRYVLGQALDALKIADRENLDTHSLRRAWVGTAKRQGIADVVGMQVTGHKTRAVYDGYARNAVGDDLRGVVLRVHDARRAAPTGAPTDQAAEPMSLKDLEDRQVFTS